MKTFSLFLLTVSPLVFALIPPRLPQSFLSTRTSFFRIQDRKLGMVNEVPSSLFGINVSRVGEVLQNSENVKKTTAWISFVSMVWFLRPFYTVMVLTFIFSTLGNSIVTALEKGYNRTVRRVIPLEIPRKLLVFAWLTLFLLAISKVSVSTLPRITKEFNYVLTVLRSEDPYAVISNFVIKILGLDLCTWLVDNITTSASSSNIPAIGSAGSDLVVAQKKLGRMLQFYTSYYLQKLLTVSSRLLFRSTTAIYKLFLSLLFSVMILWDAKKLEKGIGELAYSRIGFAYREIAPKVVAFGKLFGSSLEVTALISLCNCVLTTLGLYLLKIPSLGFFSVLTFISSFVPVAGIFVATFPPMIIALTEFGSVKALQLLVMVVGVHAFESYLLYPQIYSMRLKLHPLLLLSTLMLAEHIAGLKGLFFAVPVLMYSLSLIRPVSSPAAPPLLSAVALAPAPAEVATVPPSAGTTSGGL